MQAVSEALDCENKYALRGLKQLRDEGYISMSKTGKTNPWKIEVK